MPKIYFPIGFGTCSFCDELRARFYRAPSTGLVNRVCALIEAGANIEASVIKKILSLVLAGIFAIMAMDLAERRLPNSRHASAA